MGCRFESCWDRHYQNFPSCSQSLGLPLVTDLSPNSHPVQGHTTSSGTYVAPYVATNPNNTTRDNYSTSGNVNPYTGAVGTRNPR